MRIVALDVGQGDAILVQVEGVSLLVDTGPPGAGIVRRLKRYGVDRLEAVFITHSDLDHVGGLLEVGRAFEIGQVLRADRDSDLDGAIPIARDHQMRVGDAEIEVLWPPASTATVGTDRNAHSLVLLLRWRDFKALLTGDAEAEVAAYRPGPVDLLKVAHHGSADRGLPMLLAESRPRLALISVGLDNRHGHPHPTTLTALTQAGVTVHRTDLEGDLVVELP